MNELVKFEKCKVSKVGLVFNENMTFDEWQGIGAQLQLMHGSVGFWIADWYLFGEKTYGEAKAMAASLEMDYGTFRNYCYVGGAIELSRRQDNLSWSAHREIAAAPVEKQDELLKEASNNNWTAKECNQRVTLLKKLPTPALPEGKYQVIYADPPWDVKAGPDWGSNGPSKDLIYPTMSIEEITKLPIGKLADDNAHLYLWTINKYICESYDIARAWGFEPTCLITWVKPPHGIGLGGTFVQTTEHLLFCRKGNLEANKRIDTTWFEFKRGRHSEKPDEFRKIIEEVSPGNKIELFARDRFDGWAVWGNEV